MSTSTIEARRTPAKRLGVFLVGVAVACVGAFSLSSSQADADGFEMQFDKGAINLGAAFKGQQIMPAPKTVNGAKAAYWWDGADTGFAAGAVATWRQTLIDSALGGLWTEDQQNLLAIQLGQINVCTDQYAAVPPKPANEPSEALPNLNYPCEVNPRGATIGGGTASGWLGQTPCEDDAGNTTVLNCFEAVENSFESPNFPAPAFQQLINGAYGAGSFISQIADPIDPPINQGAWGTNTFTDPNAAGQVPFGFRDMMIPLSDSSQETVIAPDNNSRTVDFAIGANAFRFPLMIVPSPVDGSPVPITLAVTGAPFLFPGQTDGKTADELYVKGSYNPNTGDLSLSGALEARVLVGLGIQATPPSPAYPQDPPADQKGGPTPFVYCATPLEGLTLNTTGGSTASGGFPGTPYYDGVDGEGALAGSFNITKDSVPTVHPLALAGKDNPNAYTGAQAPNCATVNTVSKGAGALWLGTGEDIEVPVCAEDEVGSYPDCAKAETNFAKPTLKVKKSVKAGKKLAVTVKVKNNGNIEGTANVRVQTSNGKVKAPTLAVKVNVDPGKTGSKTVKLATKKGSKGKVTVYATTNDKTGKATTKVKK